MLQNNNGTHKYLATAYDTVNYFMGWIGRIKYSERAVRLTKGKLYETVTKFAFVNK